MIDNLCGLCLTCWPPPRKGGTACHDAACPCHVERATKTGVAYDGRDGSIEAEDDDEVRIEAEDEARREEWAEFLEWQRDMGA